jgi:hypothetical protein
MSAAHPLAAELLTTRRSQALIIASSGLVLGILADLRWLMATQLPAATGVALAWHAILLTMFGEAVPAVLAASVVARDVSARGGGRWWRPTPRVPVVGSQLVTILLLAGVFLMGLAVSIVPLGLTTGLPLTAPALAAGLSMWVAAWPVAVASYLLSRRLGVVAVGLATLVWQVAGLLQSTDSRWAWMPWTWGARAVLGFLGVEPNGIPAAEDSPVHAMSVSHALLLSAGLGAVLTLAALLVYRPAGEARALIRWPSRPGRLRVPPVLRRRQGGPRVLPGPSAAFRYATRATSYVPTVLAVQLLAAAIWWVYPTAVYRAALGLLVLPLLAVVAATHVWRGQASAWRSIRMRGRWWPSLGWALTRMTLLSALVPVVLTRVLSRGHAPLPTTTLAALTEPLLCLGAAVVMAWVFMAIDIAAGPAGAIGACLCLCVGAFLAQGSGSGASAALFALPPLWPGLVQDGADLLRAAGAGAVWGVVGIGGLWWGAGAKRG